MLQGTVICCEGELEVVLYFVHIFFWPYIAKLFSLCAWILSINLPVYMLACEMMNLIVIYAAY